MASRQNKNITTAQVHLFLTAKRYRDKDLKEFIRMVKEEKDKNSIQKNLDDKKVIDSEFLGRKLRESEKEVVYKNEFNPDTIIELKNEIENELLMKYFVYQHKIIMTDGEGHSFKLKYKDDLFDELIVEFNKIFDLLDVKASNLIFVDKDGLNCTISKDEVRIVINFLIKLNKMKDDKQE